MKRHTYMLVTPEGDAFNSQIDSNEPAGVNLRTGVFLARRN